MSGRKGQLRRPEAVENVAKMVAFWRECGWSYKTVARELNVSERQAKRYMSRFRRYMSLRSGSAAQRISGT